MAIFCFTKPQWNEFTSWRSSNELNIIANQNHTRYICRAKYMYIFPGPNLYPRGKSIPNPAYILSHHASIHSETNQVIRFTNDCQEPPLAVEGYGRDPNCRHNHRVLWRSRTLTPSYMSLVVSETKLTPIKLHIRNLMQV